MNEFLTYATARRWVSEESDSLNRQILNEAKRTNNKDTFLSHSSKDAEFLPGVITLLENHGASVYCDLADDRLPQNPNPETAAIIKNQISGSTRLVVFVTKNSKDSRWVPWELGIGDASLSNWNVALLPIAPSVSDQPWAQQEYLGLYRHIVHGRIKGQPKDQWIVRDFRKNTATKLSEWCRS